MRATAGRGLRLVVAGFVLGGGLITPALSYPRPGAFQAVSVTPSGQFGNGDSGWGSRSGASVPASMSVAMTPDARYIAFASVASNLVPGDNDGAGDVFVRDRHTGKTAMASVPSAGTDPGHLGSVAAGCYGSSHPAISANGRYVAFDSCAINLIGIGKDTNLIDDVFVHDMKTGTTTRVSVASNGAESGQFQGSRAASISADGRYVAFESNASNFADVCPAGEDASTCATQTRVAGTTQIYVHDMQTGATRLVSSTATGQVANGSSFDATVSPDGRSVAFVTYANNLVPNDVNISPTDSFATPSSPDVYVKDLKTASVRLVSVGLTGEAGGGVFPESGARSGAGGLGSLAISGNDRFVAFSSSASDLVPNGSGYGIYVRDLVRNSTQRVSVSSAGQSFNGTQVNGGCSVSEDTTISADGRYVGFVCQPDPTCNAPNPYVAVYDRVTGALDRVSMEDEVPGAPNRCTSTAATAGWEDIRVALSADGRTVAFASTDPGLVPGHKPSAPLSAYQVFVRDRGAALGAGAIWSGVAAAGSALAAGAVAYRPATHDLFVRLQAPMVVAADPTAVFGLDLVARGVRYQVRMSHGAVLPDLALYRETGPGSWARLCSLTGGYGTTGEEVVVTVPVAAVGLTTSAGLRGLDAFASSGGRQLASIALAPTRG